MKDEVNCLREFATLDEAFQPGYLIKSGAYLTTNTSTFPLIPNTGAAVTLMGNKLLGFWALKDTSDLAMSNFKTFQKGCVSAMDANYDEIDNVAGGNAAIVAMAGVNGTSTSTTRTKAPAKALNPHFEFSDEAAQMIFKRAADKLSYGSVLFTCTNPKIIIAKSADMQVSITTADGDVILVDLATGAEIVIENVVKGTELLSTIGLFNPNGLSPLVSPEPLVVPK